MREALGLPDELGDTMTPAQLMKAILQAPVDLLWNGGIGTYVKGRGETHAEAGDKANDAIRVDGRDVRARCIGEGGNLGLTQEGRIEYALHGGDADDGGSGGRLNTDFIDNSAGVDTSDHEVNIKILLDRVVKDGDLTEKQRNSLLVEMTDEVADLVLRDNYEQNLALANALAHAPSLLHVHEDFMRKLEKEGVLNREVEGLPVAAAGTTPAGPGRGAQRARAVGADGVDQDRARPGAARGRAARRPVPRARPARPTSPRRCARGSPPRSTRTRCAGRSS